MFFGGDVTQHRAAVPADHGCADCGCDVVVAWRNISGKGAQSIEWGFVTSRQLFVHVFFDELHGDVSRPLNHDLDVREYAAEKQLADDAALKQGMQEKSEEFRKTGGDLYR